MLCFGWTLRLGEFLPLPEERPLALLSALPWIAEGWLADAGRLPWRPWIDLRTSSFRSSLCSNSRNASTSSGELKDTGCCTLVASLLVFVTLLIFWPTTRFELSGLGVFSSSDTTITSDNGLVALRGETHHCKHSYNVQQGKSK